APWLAAIAARRSIDSLRKRGRGAGREVHDPIAYETFAEPDANRSGGEDYAKQLAKMMGELSPRQKEALELVKLKEMSLVEASAVSGQTVASLKVNIHRAIKRMRLATNQDDVE
ncbi:MAG: RNA polymerase sigma factor, partial [Sphingomicrobium sp.]